jgi:hypothetical protein
MPKDKDRKRSQRNQADMREKDRGSASRQSDRESNRDRK